MQLAVVVGTTFKHRLGNPEVVDGFIRVVRVSAPHVIAVESIEGPCHLVPEGSEIGAGSEWIINNPVDLDTEWDIY